MVRHKNTHFYEETIDSEVIPSIRKTFGKNKGKESGIKLAKKKLGTNGYQVSVVGRERQRSWKRK